MCQPSTTTASSREDSEAYRVYAPDRLRANRIHRLRVQDASRQRTRIRIKAVGRRQEGVDCLLEDAVAALDGQEKF